MGHCLLAQSCLLRVEYIMPTRALATYHWMLGHFARRIMGRLQHRPCASEGEVVMERLQVRGIEEEVQLTHLERFSN